jgi:hypothetical protein
MGTHNPVLAGLKAPAMLDRVGDSTIARRVARAKNSSVKPRARAGSGIKYSRGDDLRAADALVIATAAAAEPPPALTLAEKAGSSRPRPFRMARIRYVAQRTERGCFFGKSIDVDQPPESFQADDEGSIPFTRSSFKIKDLSEIMRGAECA